MTNMDKLTELTNKLPKSPGESNVKVLVVENNLKIRQLVVASLKCFGCHCTVATNGVEAMDKLENTNYDVLLGHIIMSEEIGIGVLRKFQEINPGALIVVIAGGEEKLRDYSKYLSILAIPFGFYDSVRDITEEADLELAITKIVTTTTQEFKP